jgi:hypothetical protein
VKENFSYALMLGVEEAYEKNEPIAELTAKIVSTDDDNTRLEKAFDLCKALGTNIESGMWVFFENQISKEYGRKFRQLQTSLRNEDNYELRLCILNREMDALTITKLSNDEFVPKGRKERNANIKKAYFDQQVRLETDEL